MKQINKSKKLIGMLVVCLLLTCFPTVKPLASTLTPEQQFRELYLQLLETGDTSVQDISGLNLPYTTCYNIMQDVKKNEGIWAYQSYNQYNLITVDKMETRDDGPYLLQFHMSHTDTNFQQRYQTVKDIIAEVRSHLDSKMTDLDKLLYFHEYVVANVSYLKDGTSAVQLGGATLAQGYGVCEGYSYALMLFLRAENITCEEVAGGAHSWVAVKLDGEWYLVDPTWDDSRARDLGTHYFFVRNDDEFYNTLATKHSEGQMGSTILDQVSGTISTSTKYTDWYVHDVKSQMYYYDGYWYYISDNTITKNNIQGTEESIVFEGTNLSITGISDGVLTFSSSGETYQLNLANVGGQMYYYNGYWYYVLSDEMKMDNLLGTGESADSVTSSTSDNIDSATAENTSANDSSTTADNAAPADTAVAVASTTESTAGTGSSTTEGTADTEISTAEGTANTETSTAPADTAVAVASITPADTSMAVASTTESTLSVAPSVVAETPSINSTSIMRRKNTRIGLIAEIAGVMGFKSKGYLNKDSKVASETRFM